jgi:hypothetical protein
MKNSKTLFENKMYSVEVHFSLIFNITIEISGLNFYDNCIPH